MNRHQHLFDYVGQILTETVETLDKGDVLVGLWAISTRSTSKPYFVVDEDLVFTLNGFSLFRTLCWCVVTVFRIAMTPDTVPQPLTCYACGVCVKLAFLALAPAEAERLRDLGVREGNDVYLLRNEETVICGVESCRIALRREVAMHVFATPLAA